MDVYDLMDELSKYPGETIVTIGAVKSAKELSVIEEDGGPLYDINLEIIEITEIDDDEIMIIGR